jgi:putative SOS response-associated peptidase YedK
MHVEEELQRPVAAWEDEEDYNPARGYNIAPRTRNPIVLRGGGPSHGHDNADDDADKQDKKETKNDEKVLRIENMQWGLVPHWMKRAPGGE